MKNLLIIVIFITSALSAQDKIKLTFDYFETEPFHVFEENKAIISNGYEWYFNNNLISPKGTVELKTNYPQFDKLVLVNKIKQDTITVYSILKPNENFEVLYNIKFDYISLNGPNFSKYPCNIDLDSHYSLFKEIEFGTIQFLGKNIEKKTNIIGAYGYSIGVSTGVKIENTKTIFQLLPFSSGMDQRTTKQVIIGEYEEVSQVSDSLCQKYETIYYLLNSNDIVWHKIQATILKEIKHKFYIRLFDNENVIIEYDYKTNRYNIKRG